MYFSRFATGVHKFYNSSDWFLFRLSQILHKQGSTPYMYVCRSPSIENKLT